MKMLEILSYIYYIVVIVLMLYSLYLAFKQNIKSKQNYFFVYVTIVFILDVLGVFLRKNFHINQFYFYFPYTLFHIIYFGCFYFLEFKKKLLFKRLALTITIISFFLVILEQYKTSSLILSNNLFLIMVIFNILLGLIWFVYIINNIDDVNITNKQVFWVTIAIILWSIFAFFRLFPIYVLFKIDKELLSLINITFSIINIITYLLYLKALRCTNYNVLRNFNYFKSR